MFEEFDDLLLDLREDKMWKRVEEERDWMREERQSDERWEMREKKIKK